MSKRLIECVPNFSEGRDPAIIDAIAAEIRSVEGVALLNVDPGKATNRTVYTFVGEPEPVCEAAFRAARKGIELIDMSRHHGEHPRFGALDVCPLVPISGISMAETSEYARGLAKRLGELGMTIYLYEQSASADHRRNLADVRAGEYEGLPEKLKQPEWQPDYGPATVNARSGATAVGARDFLIAYNVNLNTTSTRRANAIAFDVRERGRLKRIGDPLMGEPMLDEKGEPVYEPGSLQSVKAIGWFIEEYGIAQISMNLTNLSVTPIHVAFDEVVEKAAARGVRVTGSEIIGLIPLHAMLEAGRYFLRKQKRSVGVSDEELIRIATISLGLNDLTTAPSASTSPSTPNTQHRTPFSPSERIIELAIQDHSQKLLVDRTVRGFIEETASESAAPGGGSISATLGALGAALATMVANLSSHKRGWDARWEEFSEWAEKGKAYRVELTRLIDEDTEAFNALMAAFGLPKTSDEEKTLRHQAIQAATRGAIEVPLRVMRAAHDSMQVIQAMTEIGNPNSITDAAVGALCARSAVMGAFLNVRINAAGLEDKSFVEAAIAEGQRLQEEAQAKEAAILASVEGKL